MTRAPVIASVGRFIVASLVAVLSVAACASGAFALNTPPVTKADILKASTPQAQAAAQAAPVLSAAVVRGEALRFLVSLRGDGQFADWRSASLGTGIPVQDADGRIAIYAFTVSSSGRYLGYMTLSAHSMQNPVLEYSRNPSPVFDTTVTAQRSVSALLSGTSVRRQVFFGPLDYRVEVGQLRASDVEYVPTGMLQRGSVAQAPAASARAPTSLGTNYLTVYGVPDFDQFVYDYRSTEYNSGTIPAATSTWDGYPVLDTGPYYSGCFPTSAGNIIYYWATELGYLSLFRNVLPARAPTWDPDDTNPWSPTRSARQKLVNDLHIALHTFAQNVGAAWPGGSAWPADASSGMVGYASQVGGYSFTSNAYANFTWSTYRDEINWGRPVLLAYNGLHVRNRVNPSTLDYGSHAVTGVGYDYTPGVSASKYLIIHDNWPGDPADVYVEFDGLHDTWSSDTLVTFKPYYPPANDNFASAQTLWPDGSYIESDDAATIEPGEPNPIPSSPSVGASVWHTWTAPFSGPAAFDTLYSDFDTVLGAYTGTSVNALNRVASNDDAMGTAQSRITFNAVAGTTYHIAVSARDRAHTGDIVLHWGRAAAVGISAASVCPYGGATFRGTFAALGGAALPNRLIALQAWTGSEWYTVTTTDSGSGAFKASCRPTVSACYRFLFEGDDAYSPAASGWVLVSPVARVGTPKAPQSVRRNTWFSVTGTLLPAHSKGARAVILYCYRYEQRRWKLKGTSWAVGGGSGYTAKIKLASGKWRLRAYHPKDSGNAAAWSGTRSLTAR